MPVKQLLSADQFLHLPDPPDGAKQELVRGEIVTMPPRGGLHGATCSKIDRRIGNFVVAPEDRTVTIYRSPHQGLLLHDRKSVFVSGDTILPGFECRVADLLP
jgi:Uma2 family endonuclease